MTTTDEQGWKGRARESTQALGPVLDELRSLARRVSDIESSSSLRSAAISEGGLVIKDGGGLTVRDGGSIRAEYSDGSPGAVFGPLFNSAGQSDGIGLLVQAPDTGAGSAAQGADIFRARVAADGTTTSVVVGQADVPVGDLWASAGRITYLSESDMYCKSRTDMYLESTTGWGTLKGAQAWLEAKTGLATVKGAGAVAIDSGGQVEIKSATDLVFIDHQTTAAGANCYIAPTGAIMRSTSSLRYKRDIEDATIDPAAVLQLRPRTWRDRREVAANPDTTQRYIGFIAEELDALGLGQFVTYDADGPESISYDRLAAALIPVVRQQQDQLADQQRQIDELRNLVTPTPKEAL